MGNRQTGRLFSSTIYNSEPSHINIQKLIKKYVLQNLKLIRTNLYKKNSESSNKVLSFIINVILKMYHEQKF